MENKSMIPRVSLSRIDEDSVWEKSINSPSGPSSESDEVSSPEKTPEKARQKIKTLEEVLHNTQLDFDTLKEYTVLERQVLNYERIADISQPDILASLINNSLTMDRSRRSFANEDMDSFESQMNLSMGNDPVELDLRCPNELMNTIKELQLENDKLKVLLGEKEAYLQETIEKQSYCTETPIVAELQQQIEELVRQNKQYEESIESLTRVKEAYEKMCSNENNEQVNVVDLQNQIKMLEDENNNLKQDAESNHRFKDLFEAQQSDLRRFQEDQAKLVENTVNLQNHIKTLESECEEVRMRVQFLNAYEERFEEQTMMLKNLKNELQLPENSENIVICLKEYITDLQEKFCLAEVQLSSQQSLQHSDEKITELKNQIAELTAELEELKSTKLASETVKSPNVSVNGADQSHTSECDSESTIIKLLAEIESHRSEIEELKSTVHDLEAMLETKENSIAALEDDVRTKASLVSSSNAKTNILSSYMTFLTKHLEKLSNNNNALCLLIKDKSDEVQRLKNHLNGVKTKLRNFVDQNATESDKVLDASSYFYDLFESDAEIEKDLSVAETESDAQNHDSSVLNASKNLNQIADFLSTSKSFVDFSYCLNTLFSTADLTADNTRWLNNASSYFHQLFDSVSLDDTVVERSELNNQSLSNASNYFNNFFNTPNSSVVDKSSNLNESSANNQTLNDTSNYWYNLFDTLNVSEIKPDRSENVGNESVLNVSNFFSNLFKSQNNTVTKSPNVTTETSVLDASNCLNTLFKSHNNSVNKSQHISNASKDLFASNCIDESQSSLSRSSAGLQNLFAFNNESSGNLSFDSSRLNETQSAVQPEIALCDGTLNATAMFNGNQTCVEDPLKSFCLDATLIDQTISSSGFMSDSLSTEESMFDLSLSPESFLRKIVNLKILLNQFEDGLQDLSVRRVNASMVNDPFSSCFNVLMKSYTSTYGTLKNLVKAFDLDDLVLEGFEMSLRESTNPLSLTLQYEAVDKELHNLSADLTDQTLLICDLENQIDLETTVSKTLEESIHQKESTLQDLRNSLMKSETSASEISEDEEFVLVQESEQNNAEIASLENELVDLKNNLESKEQKIKELSCVLDELKVKNDNTSKLQRCYNDLLSKVKVSEEIVSGFNHELKKFKDKSVARKDKITTLLAELKIKDDLIKSKCLEFESIETQFSKIEDEIRKLRDENPAEPVVETSAYPLNEIKEHLICLLNEKGCLEEGLLDLVNEVGVLKATLESKENALNSQLLEREQTIKELSERNLEEMRKKTQNLEVELNDKESSIKQLLEQVGDFTEDKEYLETELIKLMQQVDNLTSELENKDEEVNVFKEETKFMLEDMKEALKQNMLEVIINDKMSQESRISELVAQLNALQTEKEQNDLRLQLTNQTQAKLSEIENELKEKQRLSAELEEQVNNLEEDRLVREKKMTEFLEEMNALKSLLENKDSEICSLKEKADGLDAVKLSLQELTEEKVLCEKRVSELVEELGALQTIQTQNEVRLEQIELVQGKLVEVEKKLEEKEVQAAELESKLSDFEADKKRFENQLNEVLGETDKLREESKSLAVLEQLVTDLTEDKNAKEKRIEELTSELMELQTVKIASEASAEELSVKLNQAEEDLKAKLVSLEEDRNAKEQRLEDLANQLSELEKAKSASDMSAEETMEQLSLKLNQAEQDLEEKQAAFVGDRNAKEKRIEELLSQLTELEKAKTASEASAEETLEQLSLKLNQAEQDLEEKQALLEEFQKKWKCCEEEKNCLESELTQVLEEQKSLRTESGNLAALQENLVTLAEEGAAKDNRIEELLERLADFEVEKSQNAQLKELAEQASLKLTKTECELKEKEERVAELEEKVKDFETDKKYYEVQMMELMQQVDALKSQLQNQGSVEELEGKLNDFEVDKKYYEDQMMALMQQVDTLKSQLLNQSLENSNAKVDTSLALDQTVTECEEKIVKDRHSSESKAASGDKMSGEYSALETKLREEEELIAQLKEKLNKLDEEKSGKEAEVSVLLGKVDSFQARVEEQLNEIDRLNKLTSDLEQQVRELSRSQNSVSVEATPDESASETPSANLSEEQNSEVERLIEEISALSKVNANLKTESAILSEEKSKLIEDFESKIAAKTAEFSKVLSELESNKEQVAKLTAELNSLEKSLGEKNECIAEMQALVDAKSTEIDSLKTELSKASENSTEVSGEFKAKSENETPFTDLSQKVESLVADIFAKTEEVSRLSIDLEQKSAEVSDLEKQLSDTREKLTELESAEEQLQKVKIELETTKDLVAMFEKKMDAFEEEKRSKKAEEEDQLKKFSAFKEAVDEKTSEIENLKKEIVELNETKNATINNLDAKLRKLESGRSDSEDLRESQIAKEKLVKEIKSLKPEAQTDRIPFSGLVQEFMTSIMEKQQEVFLQISSDSDALKTENKYLKTKDAESKKWLSELESENGKLQTLIKEKDDKILASDEKLSALKNELKTKDDLVQNLQSQLDSRETELAQLKTQLAELKDSTASQQAAEEIKLQTNEINKLTSECDSLRSKLKQEEDSVSSLNKLIDSEIAKFTELNKECDQLKKELSEVLLANENLKSSLICRDDEIHQLKETLDRNVCNANESNDLKNKYNEAVVLKEALSVDIAALQRIVDEKTDLIKTLESQASQNIDEVTSLKKDLENKSAQMSSLSQMVNEKTLEIDRLNALLEKSTQNETESDLVSISGEKLKALTNAAKATEESEKIIDSLNAEIKVLKDTVSRHISDAEESRRIKTESNKLKLQVEKLNEDTKLLGSKLMIEKNRVTIMVSEIKVLEEEKVKLSENLNQLEIEKAKLKSCLNEAKLSSFEHSASPGSSADGGKKSNDNSPNIMFKRNMMKCEKLNRQNAVLEKKVEDLMDKEEKLVQIEESLKSLLPAGSPSSATSLVGILKQKVTDTDENLAKISKQLSQKDIIIAQQAKEFKEKINELNAALEQSQRSIASLTASLNESEEKRKTLDEECVMTWQQCNALERDYAEALKRENELKRKLFETTTASESCFLSESEVVKLKEEKDALSKENQELSTQIRSLKNEKRQMVSDFYKAKAKAKEAESELSALKTRVDTLEKEKIDLDVKNSSLKKKLIEVTDEKDNLSSSLNTLLVKYDALETCKNSATDDQLASLKTQNQKFKTELVEKNAKITMLELQIQSENYPYKNKALELETNLSGYKKKCEELRSQLRRYQASIQESTVQECGPCFARRTRGKSEVGVQTVANLHLDGDRSSIVQANAEALMKDQVKKLQREHETLKRLCRIRAAKITSLEQYIKQNNLPVPDSKENPEVARPSTSKTAEKEQSLTTRRVLTEIPPANAQF